MQMVVTCTPVVSIALFDKSPITPDMNLKKKSLKYVDIDINLSLTTIFSINLLHAKKENFCLVGNIVTDF